MYQTIRYEKQDNIGILTINRPEALNALNSTVIGDLEQAISEVEEDAELGALIINGEGSSFVAGADIGEQLPLDVAGGRSVPPHRKAGDSHHCRCQRLRSGRRLRAGHELRHHSGCRPQR